MAQSDLQKEFDAMKKDLGKLQKDFGKLAEDTGKATQEARATLEEEAQKLWDRLQNAGETVAENVVETGEGMVDSVQRTIEDRPLIAAATALGVGVVVGFLLSRK